MAKKSEGPTQKFLGIDGGATRTVALLADSHNRVLRRLEAGPANLKLMTDTELTRHLRSISTALPCPDAVGIGLAGGWDEPDWRRIRAAAAKVWPDIPCHASNDLETALTAAFPDPQSEIVAQILVLSGTGSCCYGKNSSGQYAKVGGWGHVLGDQGSGYEIGLRALQEAVSSYDRDGSWPKLGSRILHAVQLNEPNDLIDWAQSAKKSEIASLAIEVFAAWHAKEKIASEVIRGAALRLAEDAVACARKLAQAGTLAQFALAGSILLKQPRFAKEVTGSIHELWPDSVVLPLKRENVWGAVELARQEAGKCSVKSEKRQPDEERHQLELMEDTRVTKLVRSVRLSPTEERNPLSTNLDRMPLAQAISLMLSEDSKVPRRLLTQRHAIEKTVRAIVRSFRRGGRLFYVGSGTSGRLGVLDASECPPTFRTPPELVQGIISGGQPALWKSIEGAEDDAEAGGRALQLRGVNRRDVVIGIAASGTTPFVWGALQQAKLRKATTVLLCFNPYLKIAAGGRPDILIAPNLGPELLTGSTRLKAGTATKLLLNLFTTLAMVKLGKVMSNLMVDLNPANIKLRDRAVRIVQELTRADAKQAHDTLEQCGWVVKQAVARLSPG